MIDLDQLRDDYRIVRTYLRAKRNDCVSLLSTLRNDPVGSESLAAQVVAASLANVDGALAALDRIGRAVPALIADQPEQPQQAPLIEPPTRYP